MSGMSERIREIVEGEPVVLFMKGTPEWIACGNSDRALAALRAVGAPVATVDILFNIALGEYASIADIDVGKIIIQGSNEYFGHR